MTPAGHYRIELASEARPDLHRLPSKVATTIIEFITGALAGTSARVSQSLTNELAAYRSARRGDYRVLIRVDEAAHTVLVVRIDHRANEYRPR